MELAWLFRNVNVSFEQTGSPVKVCIILNVAQPFRITGYMQTCRPSFREWSTLIQRRPCVLLIFTSRLRPTNLIKQPWTLHWRSRCAQWKEKINIDNDTLGVLSKAKGQTARLAMILYGAEYCIKTATSPLNPTNSLILQVGEESMTRVCAVMNHLINVKYIICPLAASPASPTGNADENLVKNERNVEHEKNRKNHYTYWVLFISFPCFTKEWVFSSERKISRSIRTTDFAEDGRSWHWHVHSGK